MSDLGGHGVHAVVIRGDWSQEGIHCELVAKGGTLFQYLSDAFGARLSCEGLLLLLSLFKG